MEILVELLRDSTVARGHGKTHGQKNTELGYQLAGTVTDFASEPVAGIKSELVTTFAGISKFRDPWKHPALITRLGLCIQTRSGVCYRSTGK